MAVALNNAHNGNLGGIAGADAMCAAEASAAGFGGTWRAFLSSSTQQISAFFSGSATSYPVINRNSVQVKASWAAWISNGNTNWGSVDLFAFDGKEVDEGTGASPDWSDADGWHGSNADGTAHATDNCSDWTSTSGNGKNGEWDGGCSWHWSCSNHRLFKYPETHSCTSTLAVLCIRIAE